MKNVLVTGGAGFIGSHLCEKLLKDSHVICVDNLVSSTQRNIDHLLQNQNFEFLKIDINEPIDLKNFKELDRFQIEFTGLREVYHLACPTSAKNFDKYKMDTLFANSLGMKNVLDLAVKYKSKLVHGSTSVVYGPRQEARKFKEEDYGLFDHLSPRSCYDEGKRFSETMVATYKQVHKIDGRIARIFRTFGPRQRLSDGEMMPDFVLDAISGNDLVIYGDDAFKTSLCYIDDVVDGLIKLMEAPDGIDTVNLGSDVEFNLTEVAQKIIEMTDSKSKVVYAESLPFITQLGLPDIRKAKDELGWFPIVGLDEGLRKTVEYVQAHREMLGT